MYFSLTWEVVCVCVGCKCGEADFTPKAAYQNLGQSLGVPKKGGEGLPLPGRGGGTRGEGRG